MSPGPSTRSEDPTLTVGALLRWPPLAEAEVLAGERGLDREVSWPVTLRVRPPAFEPLGGHELAIVSVDALRLLDDNLTLAQLIGRLAERNVSGVVVVGAIDSAAVDRANRTGLALLRLPDSVHFADLGPAISRIIADQRTKQYQLGLDVQHQLTAMSMAGRGLGAIVTRVAELASRPAVLLDETGEVIAREGSGDGSASVPLIASLTERFLPLAGGKSEVPAARFTSAQGVALAAPIVVREIAVGYLALLARVDDFDDEDHIVVTRGSLVCALELAKQEAVTEAERRLRGDFFDALLNGAPGESVDALVDRGQRLGYDLRRAYVALAVAPDESDHSSEFHDALLGRVARETGEFLTSRRAVGLVALRRRSVALFLSINLPAGLSATTRASGETRPGPTLTTLPGAVPPAARSGSGLEPGVMGSIEGNGFAGDLAVARRFAEELRDYLAGPVGISVSVGLGRYHPGLAGLRIGWREAEQAGQIGREFFGPGQITAYGDLGVYRLLYAFRESHELATFCEETLSVLIDYDDKNGTELLQTLEVFFRCDASLRAAADALFLHRNSMAYRLRRISEITSLDLDNLEDRFRLQLALKGYRLVQGKQATPRGAAPLGVTAR